MDSFPGRQLHCHNFRHNEPFRDQRVLVVGASYSGTIPATSAFSGSVSSIALREFVTAQGKQTQLWSVSGMMYHRMLSITFTHCA